MRAVGVVETLPICELVRDRGIAQIGDSPELVGGSALDALDFAIQMGVLVISVQKVTISK